MTGDSFVSLVFEEHWSQTNSFGGSFGLGEVIGNVFAGDFFCPRRILGISGESRPRFEAPESSDGT